MLGISCPVTEMSQGDRGQIVTTEGDEVQGGRGDHV